MRREKGQLEVICEEGADFIITSLGKENNKEFLKRKIYKDYEKIVNEINENSNIQIISKNKSDQNIINLLEDLILDHKEQTNLRKIESLEQKLINNLDESSYSELIKLKSQLNRD